jgi:hypothetical protein
MLAAAEAPGVGEQLAGISWPNSGLADGTLASFTGHTRIECSRLRIDLVMPRYRIANSVDT